MALVGGGQNYSRGTPDAHSRDAVAASRRFKHARRLRERQRAGHPARAPRGPAAVQRCPVRHAVLNDLSTWRSNAISNPQARHKFALNTCNGCHSSEETGTGFLHVSPRFPGQETFLSGFLTGITVSDPVTGEPRTFNDLSRRNANLRLLVCGEPQPTQPARAATTGTSTGSGRGSGSTATPTVRRGIGRVH